MRSQRKKILLVASLIIGLILVVGAVSAYIINSAPVAAFTYSPISIIEGDTVNFNGSISSDSDGNISTYAWDFGTISNSNVVKKETEVLYAYSNTGDNKTAMGGSCWTTPIIYFTREMTQSFVATSPQLERISVFIGKVSGTGAYEEGIFYLKESFDGTPIAQKIVSNYELITDGGWVDLNFGEIELRENQMYYLTFVPTTRWSALYWVRSDIDAYASGTSYVQTKMDSWKPGCSTIVPGIVESAEDFLFKVYTKDYALVEESTRVLDVFTGISPLAVQVYPNETLSQSFIPTKTPLVAVNVAAFPHPSVTSGSVEITIKAVNSSTNLYAETRDFSNFGPQFTTILLPDLEVIPGQEYILTFKNNNLSSTFVWYHSAETGNVYPAGQSYQGATPLTYSNGATTFDVDFYLKTFSKDSDVEFGSEVSYTYPSEGNYTVKLFILDNEGKSNMKEQIIEVGKKPEPPTTVIPPVPPSGGGGGHDSDDDEEVPPASEDGGHTDNLPPPVKEAEVPAQKSESIFSGKEVGLVVAGIVSVSIVSWMAYALLFRKVH